MSEATRNCLTCGESFKSLSIGNRICPDCKRAKGERNLHLGRLRDAMSRCSEMTTTTKRQLRKRRVNQ